MIWVPDGAQQRLGDQLKSQNIWNWVIWHNKWDRGLYGHN